MNASPAQPESTTTADRNVLSPARAVELMRTGTVFVAGAGVAGRGVLTMLRALSPSSDAASDQTRRVVIVDDNPAVEGLGVAEAIAAGRTDPPGLLITSPGWRPGSELLLAAAEAGVPVIGDIEAAWLADQAGAFGEPRAWLAVTGTNGKTTATAMLTAMHVADGRAAVAVGNIGTPPGVALTAESRGEARVDVLVAEASSFQLHWAPTFAPTVGCVLNLAEDHIDWHGSFEGYAGDKARVYRSSWPVLALDDAAVLNAAAETSGSSVAAWAYTLADPTEPMNFPAGTSERASSVFRTRIECIVGVHAGRLVQVHNANPGGAFRPGEVRDLRSASGISPAGPAGVADAAAAAAMALRNGVSVGAISEALDTFSVQAHRGQVVHDFGGVQWIDNSKATNPHAAEAALLGQGERSVVWVAGGQLKGAQVTDLIAKVYPHLKAVIALGADRGIILDAIARHAAQVGQTPPECVDVSTTDPDDAMRQVVAAAHRIAASGDKVILAPAAASLDMYTGMGQRGELFATHAIQTAVGE